MIEPLDGNESDELELNQINMDFSDDEESDLTVLQQELDEIEREEQQLDDDIEPEYRDGVNKECLQAFSYNRAFVINGPVVKVYKTEEEEQEEQRLKYIMHFPLIKDSKGQIVNPSNLILHNNEQNILIKDEDNMSKIINYDLEKGQVVDEFSLQEDDKQADRLTGEFKNSQNTAS